MFFMIVSTEARGLPLSSFAPIPSPFEHAAARQHAAMTVLSVIAACRRAASSTENRVPDREKKVILSGAEERQVETLECRALWTTLLTGC